MGKEEGYKNLIPAKKGEIRNPNGRPKGTLNLATRIQKMLDDDEFTANMVGSDGKQISFKGNPAEAIIRTAILKSMSGDKKWAEWLAKHGFGTKQIHEIQNDPVNQILEKYGLDNAPEELRKEQKQEESKQNDAGENPETS